ncbi:MAG: sigma 54-interacting transcriptional regulator [Proteobacteria bacterium]|nr:sigma 54-interacting transcriptional regulator [Pseudomonadota bacterium]
MEFGSCWEAVVENVRDGLIVVAPTGKIMAVNPAMERLTGYTEKELIGQSCLILNCTGCQFIGGKDGKPWCKLFEVGRVKGMECILTNKNGRSVHVLKSGVAMHDAQGNPIGIVETLTDISESVIQQEEILYLRKNLCMDKGFFGILGSSPPMQQLFELIDSVSKSEAPVLIQGESGTGKELVARAIHEAGHRKMGPFIKVNCAALNENLLESELFGHVKGAYSGANRDRVGRFEAAHGGTIFLDEIGDIPLSTQVKLLRVLEEKEIEKVGDHVPIPMDVRIISATNKDLNQLIVQNTFREDFYFRINVFPIYCPPLISRKEDIPLLAKKFIDLYAARGSKKISGVSSDALECLLAWHWPGNVRELRNVIEYALVLCPGDMIEREHLPRALSFPAINKNAMTGQTHVRINERNELVQALNTAGGNQSQVGRVLGISRVTVWKRMKKYGISPQSETVL